MPSTELVPDVLATRLATRGWRSLTPVQRAVLEVMPANQDLLVSAPTGSGKTFAFGLACARALLAKTWVRRGSGPYMLVITPTRELTVQVAAELDWLYGSTEIRVGCVTGGTDIRAERQALRRGYEILVGSPGRLRGHVGRGDLDLGDAFCVILDEADEMLDMGFREDLEAILDATPDGRRTLMFTATLAPRIEALAARYQKDARRLDLCPPGVNASIGFHAVQVAPVDVDATIVNLLRYHESVVAMVFCNRRDRVDELAGLLSEAGFRVGVLSGAHDQQQRTAAIQALRSGQAKVCVATDVAARGLDLPQCGLVIHAELPQNRATLVHRSGRTGRAGRSGLSIMLVPHRQRRKAEALIAQSGLRVRWMAPPWPADTIRRDQARLRAEPALNVPATASERSIAAALLEQHGPERLAVAFWRRWNASRPVPRALRGLDAEGQTPEWVWFVVNRGILQGASIGQLLPMICRIGKVGRKEIGRVRLFESETQFEIAHDAAQGFATAAAFNANLAEQIVRLAGPPSRTGASRGAPAAKGGAGPDALAAEAEAGRETGSPLRTGDVSK